MNIYNIRQIRWGLALSGLLIILIITLAALLLPWAIKQDKSPWKSIFFTVGLIPIYLSSLFSSLLIAIYLFETSDNGKRARKMFGCYIFGITGGLLILFFYYSSLINDGVCNIIYDFLLGIFLTVSIGFIIGQLLSYLAKPDANL